MKTDDLVSIIIPCYNQAQYLEETVESVLGQTYPNIEIIIINDGSPDNTEEVADRLQAKYPEKIQVISQKNSGVSKARNNAIKQASGKYILPLDADDLIDKDMIASCLKSMKENNADIVYVDVQCFGLQKNLVKKIPFSKNNLLYQCLCSVSSLFKRKIWEELGGYSENMKEGYEDWEFWIHAFKKGFKFQLLSMPFLLYRTKEISRDTLATKKDAYLKAIIILNHPELYTSHQVQDAIKLIKKTEELPDLYFYHCENSSIDKTSLSTILDHYLATYELQEKQIIKTTDNKKIGLCNLNLINHKRSIQNLYKKMDINMLLFYAPLRYEVPFLKSLDLAWDKNKGIIEPHGSIFPFVYKSKRENPKNQLIAYQRLLQYQTKRHQFILDHKIKILTNKEKLIREKDNLIHEKDKIISNKNKIIETLINAIQEIVKVPITKNPIRKYKAYKAMLNIYNKIKRSENGKI